MVVILTEAPYGRHPYPERSRRGRIPVFRRWFCSLFFVLLLSSPITRKVNAFSPKKWLPHLWCNYGVTASRYFFPRRNNKTLVVTGRAPRQHAANSPRFTTIKPPCHHEFTTSCIAWRNSHDPNPRARPGGT
jgi:hypothetical protein